MHNQSDVILVTRNYGGNLHATADAINRESLAEFVLSMSSASGHATIVVFRVTRKQAQDFFWSDK